MRRMSGTIRGDASAGSSLSLGLEFGTNVSEDRGDQCYHTEGPTIRWLALESVSALEMWAEH